MIISWNEIKNQKKKYWAVSPLLILSPGTRPKEAHSSLEILTSVDKKVRVDPVLFCEDTLTKLEKDVVSRVKETFKVAREFFKQQRVTK